LSKIIAFAFKFHLQIARKLHNVHNKVLVITPLERGEMMIGFHGQYLVDEEGNRRAVVIPISDWRLIVEALEELDDIRAYDEAKGDPSEAIPFEQAVSEINKGLSDWST
jgi:hypothetical protein